jgi:pilus assembly protein CpaE
MELLNPTPTVEKTNKAPVGRPEALAFVTDAESETVLRSVFLEEAPGAVMRGDITQAVQHLSGTRSPRILVVDISDVGLPVTEVHRLADVCEPGVSVIVIGTRNEVGLYRDLQQAGVADYIVKPLTAQLIARALNFVKRGAEPAPISRKLGKLIAFVGARGGVGTSTMAVNLSWYLANRQARRVALVDLDLHNGTCNLMLNLAPSGGLYDALENPLRVDSLFLERTMALHGERLFVLGCQEPLEQELNFPANAVDKLMEVVREQFHYVVVDIPRSPSAISRRVLEIADSRVIVVDQTLAAIRDAARLGEMRGLDGHERRDLIVVNRRGEAGRQAIMVDEVAGALGQRLRCVVPFQPAALATAAAQGVVPAAEKGRFADAIDTLAAEISGQPAAPIARWRMLLSRWRMFR